MWFFFCLFCFSNLVLHFVPNTNRVSLYVILRVATAFDFCTNAVSGDEVRASEIAVAVESEIWLVVREAVVGIGLLFLA